MRLSSPDLHQVDFYQVDAFTDRLFAGNPAAVCPLPTWLPVKTMQAIALENNLSETAFFVGGNGQYHLRWFTPTMEVQLCGHATLASAFVIFRFLEPELDRICFQSLSGPLTVTRETLGAYALDFPLWDFSQTSLSPLHSVALGGIPAMEGWKTTNGILILRLESENAMQTLQPNLTAIAEMNTSLIVTAPGSSHDFVYRYFAPNEGVPEDPVTGSAQCVLMPIWSTLLGRSSLRSRQLSYRGGELEAQIQGQRVIIKGQACLAIRGTLYLP